MYLLIVKLSIKKYLENQIGILTDLRISSTNLIYRRIKKNELFKFRRW